MFRTVCLRLTFWYTILFGLLSLGAFLLVYFHIANGLLRHTDDQLRATAREFIQTRKERGLAGLQNEFILEAAATGKERIFFRLLDQKGRQLAASDLSSWPKLPVTVSLLPTDMADRFTRIQLPGHRLPVRVLTTCLEDGSFLQTGLSLQENDQVLELYRETFSTAFLLILTLGGIGVYFIARRAMGGVREVTEAAARIAAGDLEQPISSGNRGEEIETLAAMFNTMQKRIAGLIDELKAVVNNVAHDLRMPITRIRGVAETTLTRDPDLSQYREMAVTVIEESEQLVGQINTILELAEIDAGLKVLTLEKVNLTRVIQLAAELYQPAAEDKGITLNLQLPGESCYINGNVPALQRLLANLLDNAVKFTPTDGIISLMLKVKNERVLLSVADNGPGISPEEQKRIFDRFYRGDASRSSSGSGLGLALVKSIVRAHDGIITVTSDGNNGSSFLINLPVII